MKRWIRCDAGKLSQVIEFDDGSTLELPLDQDGKLKWFDDKLIQKAS